MLHTLTSLSGTETIVYGALAYLVMVVLATAWLLYSSNRYWNKYPGALAEMQRADDELSRQEGRL